MPSTVYIPPQTVFQGRDLALVLKKAISYHKVSSVVETDWVRAFVFGSIVGGVGGGLFGVVVILLQNTGLKFP